jgi:predicted NBD/HSP70 family sugar kinase
MQNLTGKPELMKRMNLTLVYRALIEMQSATRAEITDKTKISTTTVRTLLEELLQSGEIIELQLDESSGGRRAQRYSLNLKRNLLLALYLEENTIVYQIIDLVGNIIKSGTREEKAENLSLSVTRFIGSCLKKYKLCAVGLGAPGIVENKHYYVSTGFNLWYINNLGEQIQNTFHLPVILENDLNAMALGFAIRYAKKSNSCDLNSINMVYIHFNFDCTGAGIIADGKILHGAKRFAGELGFLPLLPDKNVDQVLLEAESEKECADSIARLISIINCVTNPSLVVIGGKLIQNGKVSLEAVKAFAQPYISDIVLPEIIFSNNYSEDYLSGLTHLTAETIIPRLPFSNISE